MVLLRAAVVPHAQHCGGAVVVLCSVVVTVDEARLVVARNVDVDEAALLLEATVVWTAVDNLLVVGVCVGGT